MCVIENAWIKSAVTSLLMKVRWKWHHPACRWMLLLLVLLLKVLLWKKEERIEIPDRHQWRPEWENAPSKWLAEVKIENTFLRLGLPSWTNKHLRRERQSQGLPARGNKWQVGGSSGTQVLRWNQPRPDSAKELPPLTEHFVGVLSLAIFAQHEALLMSHLCSAVPCRTFGTSSDLHCGLRLPGLGRILQALQLKAVRKRHCALSASE